MDLTKFAAPTPDEIDAAIRAAHKARAVAVHDMVQAAARWLAHPHFGHRTA
jgi:hypothetical protein